MVHVYTAPTDVNAAVCKWPRKPTIKFYSLDAGVLHPVCGVVRSVQRQWRLRRRLASTTAPARVLRREGMDKDHEDTRLAAGVASR